MPNCLRRFSKLSPGEKLAIMTVCGYTAPHNRSCYASHKQLGKEMGTNATQAGRWLTGAVEKGFLRKTARPPSPGRLQWETNIYEPIWHNIYSTDDPAPSNDEVSVGGSDKVSVGVSTKDVEGTHKCEEKKVIEQNHCGQIDATTENADIDLDSPAPNRKKRDMPPLAKDELPLTRHLITTHLQAEGTWEPKATAMQRLRDLAPSWKDERIAAYLSAAIKDSKEPPRKFKWFERVLYRAYEQLKSFQKEEPGYAAVPKGPQGVVDDLTSAFTDNDFLEVA